jgi:hypothetical protein
MNKSRRSFLQTTIAGTAGVTLLNPVTNLFAKTQGTLAWASGMQINPSIDNKRVVCCNDTTMFTTVASATAATTFTKQNLAINTNRVEANMDAMVQALSGKTNAIDSWNTIFRKSDAKQWSAIKVAIKVNCINTEIMPRIAIVGKVCKELIRIGVQGVNITVYDACHDASGSTKYSQYVNKDLPTGVVVLSGGKNSTVAVTVGTAQMNCAKIVSDSDILVNCAVNKGHSQTDKGGYTLSMKNHTGSLKFSCPTLQEMIDQNKSDAILGGTPPRQQLCVVDSLWAATTGPTDSPDSLQARIIMGTFGPMVDYGVVKKIREPIMKATHNQSAITTIMSSFGYTGTELEWIEVTPATRAGKFEQNAPKQQFKVLLNGSNLKIAETNLTLPLKYASFELSILDLKGALVNKLQCTNQVHEVVWNGLSTSGHQVTPGKYILHAHNRDFSVIEQLMVVHS